MMNWIKHITIFKMVFICVIQIEFLSAQDLGNTEEVYYQEIIKTLKRQNEIVTFELKKDTLGIYKINGFFIFDLKDTLNYQLDNVYFKEDVSTIKFLRNHVYHFAPTFYSESISNLIYIDEEGNQIIFEYINCESKGNSMADVLNVLEDKIDEKTKINIVDYRMFARYFSFDNYGLKSPCN